MCFYQGTELGLGEAEIPYDRIVDPYGREFYPAYLGRDGARTPMPWDASLDHCGFSVTEPWLPIPEAHRALDVASQDTIPGSTLNRIRQFLNWRKDIRPIREGEQEFIDLGKDLLAFVRRLNGEGVLCVFNLGDWETSFELPHEQLGVPMMGHGFNALRNDNTVILAPDEAYFGELA